MLNDAVVEGSLSLQLSHMGKMDKYPAKQHARNVAKKLDTGSEQRSSGHLIYLQGQPEILIEDSDEAIKFRQRRFFYYLTGVDIPDCHVTYDMKKDLLILWIRKLSDREVLYEGAQKTIQELLDDYDVDYVKYAEEGLAGYLAGLAKDTDLTIFTIHDQIAPVPFGSKYTQDSTSLLPVMKDARLIKDQSEIELIRHANRISSHAHAHILANIGKLKNEREVAAMFIERCSIAKGKNQAYEVIAGSGENCAVLHYMDNDASLYGKQLLLLDAGAEYSCYASDITRTFPINGKFTKEARQIYETVHLMQTICIDKVRPGVWYQDLQDEAMMILLAKLKTFGILTTHSVEQLFKSGVGKAFFPHGLGHHIGLDTHDNLPYTIPALQNMKHVHKPKADKAIISLETFETYSKQPLMAGMVITIEPGCYFRKLYIEHFLIEHPETRKYVDMNVLKDYWAVGGVRIEDDILVTEDGYENLTTAPKAVLDLEWNRP